MERLAALEAAMGEQDPTSLGAGERLRRRFSADAAAWALTQVALRRKARGKFSRAAQMLFTPAGLEQATREAVARWRARRFVDAGVRRVWDVGCGIGSDALAFAEAGIEVVALDADPATAEAASHNLALVGAGPARVARAEELNIPPGDAVFLDPARRTGRGRTWRLADCSPPWRLVEGYLASERFVAVKLGPGVAKEVLPEASQWCWVSEGGDVVETCLFNRCAGRAAIRLVNGEEHVLFASGERLPVGDVGAYLAEPDGAAIRAGALAEAAGAGAWLLDEHVAYLSSDQPITTGWVTNFEVVEVLPFDRKVLARYVRDHGVGTLEIKKRAVDVDPAQLRARLAPKGPNSVTIVLARTPSGTRAIVVRRM